MSIQFTTTSITLNNLSKFFDGVQAVNSVSLQVEAGTLICLLGPSGCGKTTTLRMIAGFEEPSSGQILIGDDDMTRVPPNARPTAMVFQSYALFPHMSIFDNIAYGLRTRRVSRSEIRERVAQVVALMELEGQEEKSPPQLSGGQQQRVALARALVIRPQVLLFDEPLSNLDALLRVRMRSELRRVQQRLGITSIYVTHDQEEAFGIGDQVAIMNGGKLIQLGQPRELYHEPATRFVAEFVGLSNILPVEVVESNAEGATLRLFDQTIRSRRGPSEASQAASIVLRPEALSLSQDQDKGVPARVLTSTFLGPLIRYTVNVNDEAELIVDINNPSLDEFFPEGEEVRLHLPDEVQSVLS